MIAVDVNKLRLSMAELQRRRQDVIKKGDEGYRQKVYYLIRLAAEVSPQFSGEFASNWFIAVDGNMPVFKPWRNKMNLGAGSSEQKNGQIGYHTAARQRGDMEAITTTMARAAATLKQVTMKSSVHLVNATDLTTDGTHMTGPDGTVDLRPENIIPGNIRIESYLRARAREKTS